MLDACQVGTIFFDGGLSAGNGVSAYLEINMLCHPPAICLERVTAIMQLFNLKPEIIQQLALLLLAFAQGAAIFSRLICWRLSVIDC